MSEYEAEFGKYVRRMRKRLGFDVKTLAAIAGIPFNTLYPIENGTTKRPTRRTVEKLTTAIDNQLQKRHEQFNSFDLGAATKDRENKLTGVIAQAIAEGFAYRGRYTIQQEREEVARKVLAALQEEMA